MLRNKIISVDPGKFATKAVTGEEGDGKRIEFRTKALKLRDDVGFDLQGKSYKVKFEGETHILGDQGEEVEYSTDKATINHKLATYTAISQLIGDAKKIDLVIGCPTSIYKNESFRERYKDYIFNDGAVSLSVNDKKISFEIDRILVLPEGVGIVFLEPDLFKGNRVAIGDLGGLNMNFAIYNNLVPEISSMFTCNLGSNEIENSLMSDLGVRYGESFTSYDIQQIIKQGGVKVKGQIDPISSKILDSTLDQYMAKVIQETKKNNYKLDKMDVCFVGGTSEFVSNKIKEQLPHAYIPKNSQWANAIGGNKVGVLKFGKGNEK